MAHDIAADHHLCTHHQVPKQRGRPKRVAKAKAERKRYDAWNAFVASSRGEQGGIRSGEHLKNLGSQWKYMSPDEKAVFECMAVGRQAAAVDVDCPPPPPPQ
eukprot:10459100-Alexandrium_andersonii.AAC.1